MLVSIGGGGGGAMVRWCDGTFTRSAAQRHIMFNGVKNTCTRLSLSEQRDGRELLIVIYELAF